MFLIFAVCGKPWDCILLDWCKFCWLKFCWDGCGALFGGPICWGNGLSKLVEGGGGGGRWEESEPPNVKVCTGGISRREDKEENWSGPVA